MAENGEETKVRQVKKQIREAKSGKAFPRITEGSELEANNSYSSYSNEWDSNNAITSGGRRQEMS
jgi:hypothetical protein